MATVNRAFFSWVSGGAYFPAGGTHDWWMTGFQYGDAFSVTAHPVTGDPAASHRILQVSDVRVDGVPSGGRTLLFRVKNVGSTGIPGYGVGIGWISG